MALTDAINRGGHKLVDFLTKPNPNRGAERALTQPLPAVDYAPVNEPGSGQPLASNAWYRLIDSANREIGYMFRCRCGASNPYLYGRYDLRRELEQDHPCGARCVSIVEKKRAENGEPAIYEQVRNVEPDKDGNPIPVGAYHNLLALLPEHGKRMSERERNLVYATLPTWRLVNQKPQPPFVPVGWSGDGGVGSAPTDGWEGNPPLGSDGGWV
jgi:hypothetical protein